MTDTALVGGICVEIRKSMSRFADAYDLSNGLLTITLVKEIPEAMKPKSITINKNCDVLEHKAEDTSTKDNKAAKGE